MEQGSIEWRMARLGIPTASRFSDVMATIKSGEAAVRRNYRAELVVERLTQTPTEHFLSKAMQDGQDREPHGRFAYEEKFGRPAREERRLDQADERERNRDRRDAERGDREEKRIAAYDKKIDNDAAYQRRREERMDRFAEIQEARLAAQGDKAAMDRLRRDITHPTHPQDLP